VKGEVGLVLESFGRKLFSLNPKLDSHKFGDGCV